MSETTAAPPGWYPDPQNSAQQRYWDGAAWAQSVAPTAFGEQPAKKRLSTGAVVGIVVGALALLGVVIAGLFTAIAAPALVAQQAEHNDIAAKADVSTLGKEIAMYFVDSDGPPPVIVVEDGLYQFEGGDAWFSGAPVSNGVEFGGQSGSSWQNWCVWVTATEGELKDFEYSAERGLNPGRCEG